MASPMPSVPSASNSPPPPSYQATTGHSAGGGGQDYSANIAEQIQMSIRDAVVRWSTSSGGDGMPLGVLETDPTIGTMLARMGMRLPRFIQVHCPNAFNVSIDGKVTLASSAGLPYQMAGAMQQTGSGVPSTTPAASMMQGGPYGPRRASGPYRPAGMLAAPYSPLAHHRKGGKGGKGALGPLGMSPSFHAAAAAAAAAAGFGSPMGGLPQSAMGAVRAGMVPWAAAAAAAAAQHMHLGMFPMGAAHPGAPPELPEPPLFVRVSPPAAESPVRALQSALAHMSGIPGSSKTMAALLELVAEGNQGRDSSGSPIAADVVEVIKSHPAVRKTVESILLPLVHFQLQQAGYAVPPAPATAMDLVRVLRNVDGEDQRAVYEKLPPLPRVKLGSRDRNFVQFVQAATLIRNASGGAMLGDKDAYEMIKAVVESRDTEREGSDRYRHNHRRR
ncbi:hypothetical protein FOL47_010884 [Perkinsus chesapeaki]|uniref:Uncharacterized protein n=1 Tax=Perkinsus chesapeaki TaxID=330153 RepID=A0A7J6MNP3_PERCH|nr:hypothetical protein FOL47_010884 [Perkinsus chesapeaki]